MERQLFGAFPELLWIEDEALRAQCVRTWAAALEENGLTVEALREMPFVTRELRGCEVSMLDHIRAVTQMAVSLCDSLNSAYDMPEKINRDYVAAGALLHDVGKLVEYGYDESDRYTVLPVGNFLRHPLAGAIIAAQNGLPREIVHIIATHSFEGDKSYRTRESYLVKLVDWMQVDYLAFTFPKQFKFPSELQNSQPE